MIVLGLVLFVLSASSAFSTTHLVVRDLHGGLEIRLGGLSGSHAVFFDGTRLPRTGPGRFFASPKLVSAAVPRHRIVVRNAQTGKMLALKYVPSKNTSTSSSPTLLWAPPTLTNPITIRVASPSHDLILDSSRDYILKMPSSPVRPGDDGGLWVQGGHNIVVIGGEFDFTGVKNTNPVDEDEGRVATFVDVTGTIHMEGIYAHGDGLIEGVQMYSPQATLQLENCRFDHLHTEANRYHSDIVEWDHGKELRVDRFTGSSEVQGITNFGSGGDFNLADVNISGLSSPITSPVLLWLQTDAATLNNVYVEPRSGEAFPATLRPNGGRSRSGGTTISWPGTSIRGSVYRGVPAADFVPLGRAGTHYKSPGYR